MSQRKSKPIAIYVPDELKAYLTKRAKEDNRTLSSYITLLLKRYMEEDAEKAVSLRDD